MSIEKMRSQLEALLLNSSINLMAIEELLLSNPGLLKDSLCMRLDADQNTPLHRAVMVGCIQLTDLLLSFGAPVDIKNNFKMTPAEQAEELASNIHNDDEKLKFNKIAILISSREKRWQDLSLADRIALNSAMFEFRQWESKSACEITQDPDVNVVPIIGSTQMGKSTYVNFLCGTDYRIETIGDGPKKRAVPEKMTLDERTRVGTGNTSTTLFPTNFKLVPPKKYSIVDMPGFGDVGGTVRNICVAISGGILSKRLLVGRNVQAIIFVFEYSQLYGDALTVYRDSFKRVGRILNDTSTNILFVVSKPSESATVLEIHNRLAEINEIISQELMSEASQTTPIAKEKNAILFATRAILQSGQICLGKIEGSIERKLIFGKLEALSSMCPKYFNFGSVLYDAKPETVELLKNALNSTAEEYEAIKKTYQDQKTTLIHKQTEIETAASELLVLLEKYTNETSVSEREIATLIQELKTCISVGESEIQQKENFCEKAKVKIDGLLSDPMTYRMDLISKSYDQTMSMIGEIDPLADPELEFKKPRTGFRTYLTYKTEFELAVEEIQKILSDERKSSEGRQVDWSDALKLYKIKQAIRHRVQEPCCYRVPKYRDYTGNEKQASIAYYQIRERQKCTVSQVFWDQETIDAGKFIPGKSAFKEVKPKSQESLDAMRAGMLQLRILGDRQDEEKTYMPVTCIIEVYGYNRERDTTHQKIREINDEIKKYKDDIIHEKAVLTIRKEKLALKSEHGIRLEGLANAIQEKRITCKKLLAEYHQLYLHMKKIVLEYQVNKPYFEELQRMVDLVGLDDETLEKYRKTMLREEINLPAYYQLDPNIHAAINKTNELEANPSMTPVSTDADNKRKRKADDPTKDENAAKKMRIAEEEAVGFIPSSSAAAKGAIAEGSAPSRKRKHDIEIVRKGLSNIKEEKWGQLINLPEGFVIGMAVDNGGCGFDALAQCLEGDYTEKFLRNICHHYYHNLPGKDGKKKVDNWIKAVGSNNPNVGDTSYYLVQYTAEELKENSLREAPTWFVPEIDGRILCHAEPNLFPHGIHIVEITTDPESVGHHLITKDGGKQVEDEESIEALFQFPTLIISNGHSVPTLQKSKLQYSLDEETQASPAKSARIDQEASTLHTLPFAFFGTQATARPPASQHEDVDEMQVEQAHRAAPSHAVAKSGAANSVPVAAGAR